LGSGLFLQGGNVSVIFAPGGGQTYVVSDVVADQTGSGGTGANAGVGSIVKTGAGTLVLSGANTYSGGTTLAAGTLTLANNQALGTGALTTTGSVVDYANGVTIANPIVVNSNTTQFQMLDGTATQSGVISELNGPRPIEKISAGTWCSARRIHIAGRRPSPPARSRYRRITIWATAPATSSSAAVPCSSCRGSPPTAR
jgi:autotransporter-associated beta strand protein